MKISTRFIIFGAYTLLVSIILMFLQFRISKSIEEYNNIYNFTIKSSSIARQYQQNSAYLTQFIRSYVATADAKYEQAYNDCIQISGGTKATPINYDRGIYWSLFLGSGQKPFKDGQTKSYENVMKELNFTDEMFNYLALSKKKSEELVKLEMEAMDIIKSIPKNSDGSIPDEYKLKQLEAIEIVNGDAYEEKVSEIMVPINKFFDVLEKNNADALLEASNAVTSSTTLFFIVLAIVIISLILFLLFLGKDIIYNLNLCANLSSEISEGNLNVYINNSNKDKSEFGILINSFDKMVTNLKDIITSVLESSKEIEFAATEIAQGNIDLSSRTEMQASSLEETASSMEQIASTIKSSADNSIRGNEMMKDSETSIVNAGEIIAATTKNIEQVFEASNKITDITKIIEGIAFQTNILALNASVEAARAGEQGKGFAVVASEVRNLAQTSQNSVKDITLLIADANDKIRVATETARQSQEIFFELEAKISDTAKLMQDISSMAVEQQAGVDQVNTAVAEMDQATQQNSALVEEASASSEALMSQAQELVKLMHFFRI